MTACNRMLSLSPGIYQIKFSLLHLVRHPNLWWSYYLCCLSMTSVVIAFQRLFSPASFSWRKLPSVAESFCMIPSPVLFKAETLVWWLLTPSSSSWQKHKSHTEFYYWPEVTLIWLMICRMNPGCILFY